jgi:hypothetical protein
MVDLQNCEPKSTFSLSKLISQVFGILIVGWLTEIKDKQQPLNVWNFKMLVQSSSKPSCSQATTASPPPRGCLGVHVKTGETQVRSVLSFYCANTDFLVLLKC